ncbi:hypothetical protein [Curtobacterium sp. Leaf261]|uniref:hypothetical protein n=1 Tax=Curtobacterium sp. Leaf261 TaxID=1736311 RepID=UPI0006FB7B86|nr:hypothetical protein [Curtobacterium sp. Leaf261]KQO59758.1 hypothetical protein ASF23_15840 [Curtobacterium sp. Leaf261]
MSPARTACLIGGILLAVGGLLCGGAVLAQVTSEPDVGANIRAAALLFFRQPLAYLRAVLLFVSLTLYGRSVPPAQRGYSMLQNEIVFAAIRTITTWRRLDDRRENRLDYRVTDLRELEGQAKVFVQQRDTPGRPSSR